MTFNEIYTEIKRLYETSHEAEEYFSLRTLVGELWLKYGFETAQHILTPNSHTQKGEEIIKDAVRALHGYPLQYITGKTEFWNCEFYVGEGVLIPRSDTEISVEKALERIKSGSVVYDICCGSGCIGISLAKNSDLKRCYAFDISPIALDYTSKNGALNGVSDRLEVRKYDVMSSRLPDDIPMADVIISNPPYVTSEEMKHLPKNVTFEPSIALEGGSDGADFYRRITEDFTPRLRDGGYMIFEIAPMQAEIIAELFKEHGYEYEIFADYRGNFRTACGKKQKNY